MSEKTAFAPAERASKEQIRDQVKSVSENKTIQKILEAIPESVLILNQERQIIYANYN